MVQLANGKLEDFSEVLRPIGDRNLKMVFYLCSGSPVPETAGSQRLGRTLGEILIGETELMALSRILKNRTYREVETLLIIDTHAVHPNGTVRG